MGEVNIKSLSTYKLEFIQKFSQIEGLVSNENKYGYTYFKKDIEQWLIPIFDLALNAEFVQEDLINAPAIDVSDKNNRIAIQITGNKQYKEKIKKTLVKFYKYNLQKKYVKLYIFFLELSVPKFKISIEELNNELTKHDLLDKWDANIFDPKIDIVDFGNLVNILCTSKFYDKLNSLLYDLDRITGKSQDHNEEYLKHYSRGISINEILINYNPKEAIKKINQIFLPLKRLPDYIFLNLHLFDAEIGWVLKSGILETSNIQLFEFVEAKLKCKERSIEIEFLIQNKVLYLKRDAKHLKLRNYKHLSNSKCNICKYRTFEIIDLSIIDDKLTVEIYITFLINFTF